MPRVEVIELSWEIPDQDLWHQEQLVIRDGEVPLESEEECSGEQPYQLIQRLSPVDERISRCPSSRGNAPRLTSGRR